MALYEFIELNLFRSITPEEGGETECCLQSTIRFLPLLEHTVFVCIHMLKQQSIGS